MKKKFHQALFSPPGRWTGNHFLFKGGLKCRRKKHLLVLIPYCPTLLPSCHLIDRDTQNLKHPNSSKSKNHSICPNIFSPSVQCKTFTIQSTPWGHTWRKPSYCHSDYMSPPLFVCLYKYKYRAPGHIHFIGFERGLEATACKNIYIYLYIYITFIGDRIQYITKPILVTCR